MISTRNGRALLERTDPPARARPRRRYISAGADRAVAVVSVMAALFLTGAARVVADTAPKRTPPRRIVTIAPNAAEIVCSLGACDRLVGVSKFCVYPPDLASRPRVGGLIDPDIEKIISLRPDLVVLRGKNESVERVCLDSKIAVYHDQTDTIDGIERCIADIGARIGEAEEAERLIKEWKRRLAAIEERTSGRGRPVVLVTVSRQAGRLANVLTSGRGTFLDEMIRLAGGRNAFGDIDMPYPQISPEAIVAKRPDVILELLPESDLSDADRRALLQDWESLSSVPAVRHGRVYFLDDDNALIPSPRYAQFIEKVSHVFHPE